MLVESIYNLSSKLNHKNMPLVIGITSNSDFYFSRTIENKLDGTEREQGSRAAPQALDLQGSETSSYLPLYCILLSLPSLCVYICICVHTHTYFKGAYIFPPHHESNTQKKFQIIRNTLKKQAKIDSQPNSTSHSRLFSPCRCVHTQNFCFHENGDHSVCFSTQQHIWISFHINMYRFNSSLANTAA